MRATMHRLKATLRSVTPPIWRRIEVMSDVTLADVDQEIRLALVPVVTHPSEGPRP